MAFSSRHGSLDERLASGIGVVKAVTQVSREPLYFNVTITASEVATWYTTPGQYVDLIREKSQFPSASSFFLASPVEKRAGNPDLEFLIEDVPKTVAHELINSKPGDRVVITTSPYSHGFNLSALNPIEDATSVLMFASSYGLGPFRALIETGFRASERKHAILYALYTREQIPYVNRFPEWKKTGVTIEQGPQINIIETNPAKTIVLMVATTNQQKKLAAYFEKKGVPAKNILTLFPGITSPDESYYNKVLHQLDSYPKFPHHAENHVSVDLAI